MKTTSKNPLFLANYISLILYMSWNVVTTQSSIESCVPFLISSFMFIDVTYISACNVRDNKVVSQFCGLLILNGWYMLLTYNDSELEHFLFLILSSIIWFASIKFLLMFLFQGSGYKFGKTVNLILLITCVDSLIGICISDRIFAALYGIQFLASWLCFLFALVYHWKRITFVLKSEWKYILSSVVIITFIFFVYYFATVNVQNHISNFGVYLPVLLFSLSIHNIVLKEHRSVPLSTVFTKMQTVLILSTAFCTLGLVVLFVGGGFKVLLISVNAMFAFIYLCNVILGHNLKSGKNNMVNESKYEDALRQLKQEELLKTEFANFLHDDVLQDLLSVKNMLTKAHRPDVQDIINETLHHLNIQIREQMQDYHPVLFKNLTIKENYQNLIDAVSQSFPQKNVIVSLDCSNTLFLVEPYNILIYRILKELLTNVYKHSDGNRAWVVLLQEHGIIELSVSDDGTASSDVLTSADKSNHKGIASICEQVNHIDGIINISDNTPHGVCLQIQIPMKGDVSYKYFIS